VIRRLFVLTGVVLFVLGSGVAIAAARTKGPGVRRLDPVLLVHGFRGSSHGWHALIATLEAKGYRASEITAIDYGNDESNIDIAHDIARAAAALRASTGASRIDVVSHSMGAISSRYYLERLGGAAHVDAWVSLAGVNEGTVWAYGCYVLTQCREMVPTSSVLSELNDDFHAPSATTSSATTRYGAWWSPCDEAIIPRSNAELPGAHNVETACLDHTDVRTDPHVLAQVAQFLAQPTIGS
jgi:triacylglycerol esterase/lipase EstA (alpha/beta hydrolase family)